MLPVYVCLGQRDVEREVELVDRWRLRSPNLFIRPFDMQDETRAAKESRMVHFCYILDVELQRVQEF